MNGVCVTNTSFFDDTLRPGFAPPESPPCRSTDFMRPDEVASDPRLTLAEKREALASWASDARAVPGAPALRQLDNGAVVRVDDVLRTLESLDAAEASKRAAPDAFRRLASLRIRVPNRLKSALRRNWPDDDDDDPPPCPAMIVRPVRPLAGGEAADPGLALAA